MAVTRFYLDLRGNAKDGRGSVVITLYHNHTTCMFSTGIRLLPIQWTGSSATKIQDKEIINAKLQKRKLDIDRKIGIMALEDGFDSMTASEIKLRVEQKCEVRKHNCLVRELFEDYISLGMKDNTKTIYNLTLKKVLDFGGNNICIEDIDYKWLVHFDKYLSQTQSINGRSVYLRSLRAIYNYALHTEITDKYPFRMFSIKSEPTRKRSVTVESLRRLYEFQVSGMDSVYKDYFFLMFFLIGINSKDLLLAKKNQVNSNRLEYTREKTCKLYSIKIEPEAANLIERHKGRGKYLLDAMDHCQHYQSFARQINESLQGIGEKEIIEIGPAKDLFSTPEYKTIVKPVIPGITTYYARHTWATLAYEIGIPMDIISQALGHSFGNRTTLIYVKPDQSKVDDANRRVIDYFLNY